MSNGKKKTFHWLLIGVGSAFILLDVLFYFAVLAPTRRAYATRVSEHETVLTSLQGKRAGLNRLESIQTHLRDANGNEAVRFVGHLWSTADGFSSLIQYFNDATNRTGVQKGRLTFRSSTRPGLGLMEVQLDVPLEGTYPDIVKFINVLQRFDKLLIVDAISLQPAQGNVGLLRLNLSMVTYLKST